MYNVGVKKGRCDICIWNLQKLNLLSERVKEMDTFSILSIREEIVLHKKNSAAQEELEARLRRDGSLSSKNQIRLSDLKLKNCRVKNWLSILTEDEEYVVRRHLIDGISWPRLEAEHIELWKEYGKNRRTLMRYQNKALEKIQHFLCEDNLSSDD